VTCGRPSFIAVERVLLSVAYMVYAHVISLLLITSHYCIIVGHNAAAVFRDKILKKPAPNR